MYLPSLVLVLVSVAGVAAGCRTDDARPVDITPAYCDRLKILRPTINAQFALADLKLPRIRPLPTEDEADAPPQQPGAASPGATAPAAAAPALAPSLPDVIACVEAVHTASKAAVIFAEFGNLARFLYDVKNIAGFNYLPFEKLDVTSADDEVEIHSLNAWCTAGEIARVREHLDGWLARLLAEIDEAAAQCSASADPPAEK